MDAVLQEQDTIRRSNTGAGSKLTESANELKNTAKKMTTLEDLLEDRTDAVVRMKGAKKERTQYPTAGRHRQTD